MVSVPVRIAPTFAATVKFTVPLPVPPGVELETVSQLLLLTAAHEQLAFVETATGVPAPPAEPLDWLVGLIVYAHPLVCVTANVWLAMRIVPVRVGPGLAETLKVTVPLPLPLAPLTIVIHDSSDLVLHAQFAGAVTEIGVPFAAAVPKD